MYLQYFGSILLPCHFPILQSAAIAWWKGKHCGVMAKRGVMHSQYCGFGIQGQIDMWTATVCIAGSQTWATRFVGTWYVHSNDAVRLATVLTVQSLVPFSELVSTQREIRAWQVWLVWCQLESKSTSFAIALTPLISAVLALKRISLFGRPTLPSCPPFTSCACFWLALQYRAKGHGGVTIASAHDIDMQ